MLKLSEAERAAIFILHVRGGNMLTSNIPERSIVAGVFGIEPGMAVYKKLEKKGLVFFTEEEPMEDGFVFTNEVYLTDEGKSYV